MKKIFLFIAAIIAAISATASDQFYVIMKDGTVVSYPTDKVDSISFDDSQIAKIMGFNDMAEEIVKLKKEVEALKSNGGGLPSSADSSVFSTLWFQTIRAKDLPAIGITTDSVVDLGLSVKWANFNVGASACYEYGDHFAWGEVKTKDSYDGGNSNTYGKKSSELESASIIGKEGNLTAQYDAATQNLGGKWRMPTENECEELVKNCVWTWMRIVVSPKDIVSGYYIKSFINGKAIFLPAAGYCSGTSSYIVGSGGDYWSSTVHESYSYDACGLYFNSSSKTTNSYHRNYGHTVRPVTE